MMEEQKFRSHYDDQPNDLIDTIAKAIKPFGLVIEESEYGDGFIEYTIKKEQ